jgi:hypothetical protein
MLLRLWWTPPALPAGRKGDVLTTLLIRPRQPAFARRTSRYRDYASAPSRLLRLRVIGDPPLVFRRA